MATRPHLVGRGGGAAHLVAPCRDGEVAALEEAKWQLRSRSDGDKWRVEAGAARKMRRRVEECPDLEGGFPFIGKMARVGVLGGFRSPPIVIERFRSEGGLVGWTRAV